MVVSAQRSPFGGGQLVDSFNQLYWRCVETGSLVLKHPPSREQLAALYSHANYWQADGKCKARNEPPIEERAEIYRRDGRLGVWEAVTFYFAGRPGAVLEIGCAPGAYLAAMARRGAAVCGCEFSEETAAWLNAHTPAAVKAGAFEELCWRGHFDVIAGFDVVEHTLDPLAFFQNVSRHLAPGGVLLLQSPFIWPSRPADSPWLHNTSRNLMPEHTFLYSQSALAWLAREAGLVMLDTREAWCWAPGHEIEVFRKA